MNCVSAVEILFNFCMWNLKQSKARMLQIKQTQVLHLPCLQVPITFSTMFLFLIRLRRCQQVHLKHKSMHKTSHITTILYLPYECFSVQVSLKTHHCQQHLKNSTTPTNKQTNITYHKNSLTQQIWELSQPRLFCSTVQKQVTVLQFTNIEKF